MYDDLYGESPNESWYSIIPIAFLVSVIPLIVYGKMVKLTGDYFKYWNGMNTSLDFFSYYKSMWILISVIMCIVIFLVKLFSKSIKIQKNKMYIPMAVYSAMVILSTIFSDFKEIALWGFVERYEGMLVILAYMAIMFITINLASNEASIKAILAALICSAVVIGTIGILQYLGHDFYKSMSGKRLILPSQMQNLASQLKFQFEDKIIYSSLYHYNYVGSYMAMLFPLTFTLFILIKNKFYKMVMGLIAALMFLNMMLSHSRAGIIGGGVAILILAIVLRRYFVKKWKISISVIVVVFVAAVGFNIYSKGMLASRVGSLFKDAESLTKTSSKSESLIKDVFTKDNLAQITTSTETLKIVSESGILSFKDEKNHIIKSNVNKDTGYVTLEDSKYKDYGIIVKDYSTTTDKKYMVEISKDKLRMPFLATNNRFMFETNKGNLVDLKPIEKWGFEGKEQLGSARAYIWSRSIPLIKHSMIVGYGPDTFAAKFPQQDYVGKAIAYQTTDILVDKAHNLYIQNALNTGVISLISLLAMFVIYFKSCFRLYMNNNFNNFYSIVGLAVLVSIIGYLGAGFFNDSAVSVAPVFWVLFGVGVAANCKLKAESMKE
ncbi:O-antigen ligase family protein [Clostridium sp. CX1]|uniref:O-antigen ligase family protein n=1 Tax=Clostridium sp. CX1 TaxID=2978346 RepID=UPI0021C192D2|nr:O-antigen ligase family protein [Clostridium sp. CX1]MCT8975962.1 O-antigen ligase family protein [Clostridium sp. CX1]